jgi:hypothetical protein
MCDRTCPACQSHDHFEQYGLIGTYIACSQCLTILANRRDEEAAPLDRDPEEWAAEGTFILAGAEASDPEDDRPFMNEANLR